MKRMKTFTLDKERRGVVAAAARERNPAAFARHLRRITDLDVLREINWQLGRWPNSARTRLLADRIGKLTGKTPPTGLAGGSRRWIGRGKGAATAAARTL